MKTLFRAHECYAPKIIAVYNTWIWFFVVKATRIQLHPIRNALVCIVIRTGITGSKVVSRAPLIPQSNHPAVESDHQLHNSRLHQRFKQLRRRGFKTAIILAAVGIVTVGIVSSVGTDIAHITHAIGCGDHNRLTASGQQGEPVTLRGGYVH